MRLEDGIIGADALARRGGAAIIKNTGKLIAVLTILVAVLLTFTDVTLGGIAENEMTGTLVMMLIATYLMYFSLEEAGERLGEESEDYKAAREAFVKVRGLAYERDAVELREFCESYCAAELAYRRRRYLIGLGYSEDEYRLWLEGGVADGKRLRAFRRARRMKAAEITPALLLNDIDSAKKRSLRNPESTKLLRMLVSLIPTAVCMCVTVSVMLSVKDGLSVATVLEGILKLVTLPIVGIRGYSAGYAQVVHRRIPWIRAREELLAEFIKTRKG